jgi:tetratricopeptide (TPR) repeat protein
MSNKRQSDMSESGDGGFEACIAHYEQLPKESRKAVIDAYLQKDFSNTPQKRMAQDALRFWRAGQTLRALELYTLAIEEAPEDSILLLNRANLHTELGNITEALHDYERARAGHPRLPDHLFVVQEGLQTMSPAALETFVRLRKNAQRTV